MDFFMIREHPLEDLIMIQVGNDVVQLNREYQERVYKALKERIEK